VFDFNDKTSLQDIAVKDLNAIPTDYTSYVTEHIVEVGYCDRIFITRG
jgi:hypothetical protein